MAYDLEEQERLDELKAWWKTHGNKVIAAVSLVLVGYAGFQGWSYYQGKQAVNQVRGQLKAKGMDTFAIKLK